MEQETA
jgi:hypothetical protein